MLLTLLLLQAASAAPDIQLHAEVQAKSVTVEKQGQASLEVHAEPDAGSLVDVEAPKANGRKTLRNVAVSVDAKAVLADPGEAPQNNPEQAETGTPQ